MIHCFKCGADLPDNMLYCLNCGAELNTETPTVIRSGNGKNAVGRSTPANIGRSAVVSSYGKIAVAVGVLAIMGLIFYSMQGTYTPYSQPTTNANTQPLAMPSPTANQPAVYVASPPEQTKAEPQQPTIDREADKTAENEPRKTPPLVLPASSFPPFDEKGTPLRAVCKNGNPSYWQYDKWATCGMNGGVHEWANTRPANRMPANTNRPSANAKPANIYYSDPYKPYVPPRTYLCNDGTFDVVSEPYTGACRKNGGVSRRVG